METSQQNTLTVLRIYVCNLLLKPSRSGTSVVFCSPEEQRNKHACIHFSSQSLTKSCCANVWDTAAEEAFSTEESAVEHLR